MTDEHKADLERVSRQNDFADIARNSEEPQGDGLFSRLVNGTLRSVVGATPAGQAVYRSTDFDAKNLSLNQLLDLVEQANPEDLESSGNALWRARTAIRAAAEELDGHIGRVRWVGESGDAFRKWGLSLVASTKELSAFAGEAADQITAAGTGLASVRKSLPARDAKPDRKRPDQFTEAEKVADKDEYVAAVRVEKDRQEAINQMNRLASYYAVSTQQLQALKAPTFQDMPNVGVPKPKMTTYRPGKSGSSGSEESGAAGVEAGHATVTSTGTVGGQATGDTPKPVNGIHGRVTYPDEPVGTNINSVGTLPPATTAPVTGNTPPATGTPPVGGGQTNMFGGGYVPQVPNGPIGRNTGGASVPRTPASAQGRASTTGLTSPGSGRQGPTSQMGHPAATGQPVARGTSAASKTFPMGSLGVTGGTPRVGGTAAPRVPGGTAVGAGGANGVVGGRPTVSGSSAASGSRLPRGTVIGTGPTANAQPATGRPGVIGAPASGNRFGSSANVSRSGSIASQAVTGRPAARNSVADAERNGMTSGGSGLVRGPGSNGRPRDGRDANGTPRLHRLAEGQETHLPNKPRRDVPPVVN